MNQPIEISIVIPVFNSCDSLKELLERIHNCLYNKYNYEVILVDDGSKDGSWQEIVRLKKTYPTSVKKQNCQL